MPPKPLIDLDAVDLSRPVATKDDILAKNPHRFEFELLDAVSYLSEDPVEAVGYHDLEEDAFWVRGHIPGHPLFPGALIVEASAQLSSFVYHHMVGPIPGRFFGFGGIDKVSFRGSCEPGQRFWIACKKIILNRRYSRFHVQGICEGKIVYGGEILGVSMPINAEASSTGSA